jgi:hypothetical protein
MSDIAAPERLRRLMMEVSPYKVGHRVKLAPTCEYASEWPDTYIIVGIDWDYQRGDGHGINISIASEEEIVARHGSTDGFRPHDLLPAS